ncbi:unnamed protein product [Gordionus sp. m RMFG-2023]
MDTPNPNITSDNINNSNKSSIECQDYSEIYLLRDSELNFINQGLAIVLLVLGVIGNVSGIYVISKQRIVTRPSRACAISCLSDRAGEANIKKSDNELPKETPSRQIGRQMSEHQYILRWFFSCNLLNSMLLILSPILKSYSNNLKGFWVSYGWMKYIARYHYPISKPLLSFGTLIYVLFFTVQMLAVTRPYSYKRRITRHRIKVVLALMFMYCFVWYLPINTWLRCRENIICDKPFEGIANLNFDDANNLSFIPIYFNNDTGKYFLSAHTMYDYEWNIRDLNYKFNIYWEVYQSTRELFVNILPFFAVLWFKVIVLKRRGLKIGYNSDNVTISGGENRKMYLLISERGKKSKSPLHHYLERESSNSIRNLNNDLHLSPVNTKEFTDRTPNMKPSKRAGNVKKFFNKSPNFRLFNFSQKNTESRQHLKTLFILSVEFVFLILPISGAQMFMDFIYAKHDRYLLASLYIFFTTLQFVYVSCTFYINVAFNVYFRKAVLDCIQDLVDSVKKGHGRKVP